MALGPGPGPGRHLGNPETHCRISSQPRTLAAARTWPVLEDDYHNSEGCSFWRHFFVSLQITMNYVEHLQMAMRDLELIILG